MNENTDTIHPTIEPSILRNPSIIDILRYEIVCVKNNRYMSHVDRKLNISKIKTLIGKLNSQATEKIK